MQIIKNDNVAYFDVDETLVISNSRNGQEVFFQDEPIILEPHKEHVQKLKDHAARGHPVVVWSAGGWAWAQFIVSWLKLERYVTMVVCKPKFFYDDKRADEFMPESSRTYLKGESK